MTELRARELDAANPLASLPGFCRPNGLRLGLFPLTTRFGDVRVGVEAIASELP